MKKKIRWILVVLILVLFAGIGIYRLLPKEKAGADAPPVTRQQSKRVLNVNGLIIREQGLIDDFAVKSRLIPDEEVDLSFQTSGLITNIFFKEGTQVKKGQLLAKVNDAPLQAQLKKLQSQVQLAEDRVFRQSALLQKDAVSKEAYEQVRTDLAALNADIQLMEANIALTELRAPFDGVIGLRRVSEGAYASPTTTIATLTKVVPLKIDFHVPEKYDNRLKPGTKISFEVEGNLNTFYASVYAVESKIDPVTNTFAVRARYHNHNGIPPGRTANLKVRMLEINDAIAIPSEAIIPEMGKDKVYVYRSGKAQPVIITKGLRTESHVQVLEGLSVGDTIITSGTLQLRAGLDVVLDNID